MGRTAFLYPGQGSQKVGMGGALRESRPDLFERYLGLADEASGLPISRSCLEGPAEELTRTEVAQPALFAVSMAVTEYAIGRGLRPDWVAGHSLGEYTAAVAAGALSPQDGLRLVCLRGRLMADVQAERPGTMAAVIGMPVEQLRELCEQASAAGLVGLANLNSPTQIVVSGEAGGVDALMELVRASHPGAARVQRLHVGAGFHSPLMQPVQERLGEVMADMTWTDARVPLAANVSGELVTRGEDIRQALIAQVASPVQWMACIQALLDAGCRRFVELGPGRVLSGLVRHISPRAETTAADSPAAIDALLG